MMRDPAGTDSAGPEAPFSSPEANPFAPPNVESRRAPSTEDRRDFPDFTTKQLARCVADLQTISTIGGLPIFVGGFCLVALVIDYFGSSPSHRSLGPIVMAVLIALAAFPTGIIIMRRGRGARPLTILVSVIAFPIGVAAIGPLVRDYRLFGSDRIRRLEMRKMEQETAYRRKHRIP